MAISFFTMEREGMFYVNPNSHTSNQCKAEGHKHYKYTAKIVFSHKATLDSNHFLIDHQEIDDAIVSTSKRGSCEQYHNKIMDNLLELFAERHIPVIAIRITIFSC